MMLGWRRRKSNHFCQLQNMPADACKVLAHVKVSATHVDRSRCVKLVRKIERWGEHDEKIRECMVENGAAGIMVYAFEAFANDSIERNGSLLEEILSAIIWMFPLGVEELKALESGASLDCIIWFMKHKDMSKRHKALIVLRLLLSCDDQKQLLEFLGQIEGFEELLMEFINKRVFPTITEASLSIAHECLISATSPSSQKIKLTLLEMGLVSSLLEILIDTERSLWEMDLRILDILCSCEQGRDKAYSNALAIPVLVKKISGVSVLATDCSVSALWKLCNDGRKDEPRILVESLQAGAFQKLLLIALAGCGHETKKKANALLKMLNPYRARFECIESQDFMNLRRSF